MPPPPAEEDLLAGPVGRPHPACGRCPSRNAAVGGSPTSRHLTGRACDVEAVFSVATVKSWGVATHIGYGSSSRKVKHIDNGPRATVNTPTVYTNGS